MTQVEDPIQQVMSYIRHQASKGLDSLAGLMARTAEDWSRCLETINDRQAAFAPGSEWSPHQVLAHFVSATATVNRHVTQIAAGAAPPTAPFDEATVTPVERAPTIAAERTRVADLFRDTVTMVKSLEDGPRLSEKFDHPMFGPLDLKEWIAFQRIHSMDHIDQINKVKAEPSYPGA
jgi:hypothetical protein